MEKPGQTFPTPLSKHGASRQITGQTSVLKKTYFEANQIYVCPNHFPIEAMADWFDCVFGMWQNKKAKKYFTKSTVDQSVDKLPYLEIKDCEACWIYDVKSPQLLEAPT